MKILCAITALFFTVALTVAAAEGSDNHDSRVQAATRYLEVVSMRDLMADMVREGAKNVPPESRQAYIDFMTNTIRVEVLEKAALESMVRHFTAGELNALADFYGSKEGRSAMKKFGVYMADVMPVIQREMIRAIQQAEEPVAQGN